jgi:hypothetical protein
LLIITSGVLTYSSYQKEVLEGGSISIQDEAVRGDDGERIIQVMDEDRRLFYVSVNKCKSFYVSFVKFVVSKLLLMIPGVGNRRTFRTYPRWT